MTTQAKAGERGDHRYNRPREVVRGTLLDSSLPRPRLQARGWSADSGSPEAGAAEAQRGRVSCVPSPGSFDPPAPAGFSRSSADSPWASRTTASAEWRKITDGQGSASRL